MVADVKDCQEHPRTIEQRQDFLSPYSIGLYQVHQPISFSSPEAEMNAMADLVERGADPHRGSE